MAVREEYEKDYRSLLKKVYFDKRQAEQLIASAKKLRDQQMATAMDAAPEAVTLTYSDVCGVTHEMTRLFEAATFDVGYRYLIPAYDAAFIGGRGPVKCSDIDRILDGIARDSFVLHEPELHPEVWLDLRLRVWPE